MPRTTFSIPTLFAAALLGAPALHAQLNVTHALAAAAHTQPADTGAADPAVEALADAIDPWTVRIEPMAWWVSPAGKLKLPGASSNKLHIEDLNLDSPRLSPAGEIHFATGKWRINFATSDYSIDQSFLASQPLTLGNVAASVGDPVDTSFDLFLARLSVGYLVYHRNFKETSTSPANGIDTDISLHAVGGLRYYDIDIDISDRSMGGATSAIDETFLEPYLGARLEVDVARDFVADLEMTVGGFSASDHSITSLDIIVGFHWYPADNVGVQIGWRQLLYNMSDGSGANEFEYDGTVAGVYTGVTFTF